MPLRQECDTIFYNGKTFCDHEFEFKGFLFSDFVGIQDDQPNGLVQTNIYFSYKRPVRTRPKKTKEALDLELSELRKNASNKGDSYKINRMEKRILRSYPSRQPMTQPYLFRNVVITDITFSKIGNQNQSLPVRYSDTTGGKPVHRFLNRFDLVQYSNVIALTKLNILTIDFPKFACLYLDVIPVYYNTTISDSLRKDVSGSWKKINVTSIAFGGHMKLKTKRDKISNLSGEVSYSYFIPQLYTPNYRFIGTQLKDHDGVVTEGMILESQDRSVQILETRIEHRKPDSKLSTFFRIAYFHNVFRKKHTPGNAFVQFQVGVSYEISNVFSQKETK